MTGHTCSEIVLLPGAYGRTGLCQNPAKVRRGDRLYCGVHDPERAELTGNRWPPGARPMFGFSIIQPWASLVIEGRKQFETRSWRTAYRGLLALHASLSQEALRDGTASFLYECVVKAAAPAFPRGAILGVIRVLDCVKTDSLQVSDVERELGDYSRGRYAWKLEVVTVLKTPAPCKGALQFWQLPREIEAHLRAVVPAEALR